MKEQTKKYGYKADIENGAFTISTLETGKDWMNYLWNERGYQTAVTHTGASTACMVSESSERIALNGEKTGLLYFRDEETGAFWNPGGYPSATALDSYECTHAQLYSELISAANGIKTHVTYVVHPNDTYEVWELQIENLGAARTLSVFAFTSFDLGGFTMPFYYNAPTTSATEYADEFNTVLCASQNPYGDMEGKSGFIACNEKPSFVCGRTEDFIGITGTVSVPRVLRDGDNLSGTMSTVRDRCGILQNIVSLKPKERKTLYYARGFTKDKKELAVQFEEFVGRAPEILTTARKNSPNSYNSLKTFSPDARINTVMNRWVQKQVSYCCIGKKAVRDNAQLAVALLNFDVAAAKKTIIECIEHQYSDGHAVLLWYPVVEKKLYSDPTFWLLTAIAEYLKETGDYAFLDEEYVFLDGDRATVLRHIETGIRWYCDENNYGRNGLPKIFHADWNDALNIPDEDAESTLMAFFVCGLFKEISELYRHLGQNNEAEKLKLKADILSAAVNKAAWNGDYYVRALSKFGSVGDKGCDGGAFYFNPQSWAVMSDAVPKDRLEKVLKAVDMFETDEGVALCVPPYPRYDERVGRMSGMLSGVYENGGIYNHAGCFKVMSDCASGRTESAAKTLLKILPGGEKNPAELTNLEPYVFSNCYLKHPSVDMKVGSSWQTGTSAWGLRCYYEGILGIRRGYDGLEIKPCIPVAWRFITAEREYRGAVLRFKFYNYGGKAVSVYVGGKQLSAPLITGIRAGEVYDVVVILGEEKSN